MATRRRTPFAAKPTAKGGGWMVGFEFSWDVFLLIAILFFFVSFCLPPDVDFYHLKNLQIHQFDIHSLTPFNSLFI